jgi:sigma-B regulation protein RsbU (phosphoserine phosphatase)
MPTRAATRSTAPPRSDKLAVSAIALEDQSPLLKQVPVLLLFATALALSLTVPTITITSATALIAAAALMVAVTAYAAGLSRYHPTRQLVLIVPLLDFIAVGVLRYATGESTSIFASLAILPVVWVAAFPGRRYILYAFIGVCVGLLTPFILGSTIQDNPNEVARGLFSAAAFGLAAAVINDLARLARAHVADISAREQLVHLELAQASAVQQALLPKTRAAADGYEFAGLYLPSRAIGGDFYDWYDIEGGAALTVGDVMGKGVGAGIIAATVRAVLRSAHNHSDPAVAVARASHSLASDLSDTASFATLFHARLDQHTGIIRYIDAGHGLSLHIHIDGTWDRLTSTDLPAGIDLDEVWTTSLLRLQPGESLISCSDGILDLYDGTVNSLRYIAAIAADTTSPTDTIERIRSAAQNTTHDDDVTVLILRRATVGQLTQR